MAIRKKVTDKEKEEFIKNPKNTEKAKGTKKGDKHQVTITLTPELLMQADNLAAQMGMNRSAFFSLAIFNLIKENK